MTRAAYRTIQLLMVFVSTMVFMASFYFEVVKGLQPCPLCLMQRFSVLVLLTFSLMGICLATLTRARLVALLQCVFAFAGLFFSSRHLWLQAHLTEQVPACMPGLDVLVKYFPWQDIAHALFWGAGDCAEMNWQWLGLSMPAWSLCYFVFMLFISSLLCLRLKPKINRMR